jgi:hypothetical protein
LLGKKKLIIKLKNNLKFKIMPKGFGYGGESANQEKKNLSKDMPVVKQASWMSKHSISGGSPVAMGGSYKGSAMEMGHDKGSAMEMKGGKGKAAKKEDDFDYTPSIPGAGVTGTMVTETVGAGTGKPVYEKGKKGGGFEVKKAGEKLAGGGKVLESKKVGSKGKVRQKVRKVKFS